MIETVIIINDQSYISGGVAKIAINSAIELKKRGLNVIFFYALGPIDKCLEQSGVECVCVGGEHIGKTKNIISLLRGLWNKKAKRKLKLLLQNFDNEKTVIHIHSWTKSLSTSIFSVCKKLNFRTIITLHDYFILCQNGGLYNYNKDKKCKLKPGSFKCFLCNCDKKNYIYKLYRNIRQLITKKQFLKLNPEVIYISDFSKKIFEEKGFESSKNYILVNHANIVTNSRIEVEKNDAYCFIGRLSKDKGIDIFCEAIEKSNVKGIVIGEGPLLDEYKRKYPNLIFTGWLSYEVMEQYLNKVRCLIVTSRLYETMGLTIVEMQSRGIPCIVPTDFAGMMYIENNCTGLYYNINKLETLSSSIHKMQDNNYISKMSQNAQKKLDRKIFSIEEHVSNLIDIYNNN